MQSDNLNLEGVPIGTVKNIAGKIKNDELTERSQLGIDLRKNKDLYNNKAHIYFNQRYKEDNEIFKYRKDNPAKSNFIRFIVDLSAKYLYGRATKVRRDFGEKETSVKVGDYLKEIDLHQVMYASAKKAAVFGKQVVRFIGLEMDTKSPPPDGKSTEKTRPYPVLLNPERTWTKFSAWGTLIAVYLEYDVIDYAKSKKIVVHEFITESSRAKWSADADIPSSNTKNFIPLSTEFVVLKNNEDMISDIEDIKDLSIDVTEAYTDMKHFHAKHGWPQLLSEVDLSNVAHSPNKVWQILSDIDDGKKVTDRVAFLTWDGKMKEAHEYASRLERNLFILSNTARISTGDLEAIGQLRSGAALTVAHSIAIHKTQAKQIVWEKNEKEFLTAFLKHIAYLQDKNIETIFPDLDIKITYPTDFVPGDDLQRTQVQQVQAINGLKSIKDIVRENYPELDNAAIDDKFDEILEEQRDMVDSTRRFESTQVGGTSGSPTQKSQEQTTSQK